MQDKEVHLFDSDPMVYKFLSHFVTLLTVLVSLLFS